MWVQAFHDGSDKGLLSLVYFIFARQSCSATVASSYARLMCRWEALSIRTAVADNPKIDVRIRLY